MSVSFYVGTREWRDDDYELISQPIHLTAALQLVNDMDIPGHLVLGKNMG